MSLKPFPKHLKSDDGATAVTTVLLLSSLVLVTGLVLGLGQITWKSLSTQNAADAIALASARMCAADELACVPSTISTSMVSLATANEVALTDVSVDLTAKTVRVNVQNNFTVLLGTLFNLPSATASKNSTATWDPTVVSTPLPESVYPLFVNKCLFDEFGKNVQFARDFAGKNSNCANGTSYFTWLQIGGQNTCTYRDIAVGWVDSISNNPPANCQTTHTVAIFTEENVTPDQYYVVGFVDIELINAQQTGGTKPITMKFLSDIRFADASGVITTGTQVRLVP